MEESIISFTWMKLSVSTLAAYIIYYVLKVAQKPILACNEKFENVLMRYVPLLTETYWPTIWCIESRFQTILRSVFQSRPSLSYHREVLSLSDGGAVALDWLHPEAHVQHNENKEQNSQKTDILNEHDDKIISVEDDIPVILILPGLVGSSQESYALHLSYQSVKQGYRSVVFNYRGNGGQKLLTPRTYCATWIDDLASVVKHIQCKHPHSPILAVGISLGGIILTNYAASHGKDCGLVGCLTVSTAWNSFVTSISLEQPINHFLFNSHLCHHLKEFVIRHGDVLKTVTNFELLNQCKTIRDFDTAFTSPLFGYKSYEDYYKDASIDSKLHRVKVPLLNLNAADDPFAPEYSVPVNEARRSNNVAIALTCRGGHIGFFEGVFIPNCTWYVERLLVQFADALFNHKHEFHFAYDSTLDIHDKQDILNKLDIQDKMDIHN